MTDNTINLHVERHIREVYAQVPIPVDEILRKVRTQPRERPRTARVARVAGELAVFFAVVITITVVVLLPRLARQSNGGRVSREPSAPATAPSTTPSASVADCSLPVARIGNPPGFLDVATGVFTTSAAQGEGYARALGKWVPVPTKQIAPDGSAYASAAITGQLTALYITDARGRHRVATSTSPLLQILGFVSPGVVFVAPDSTGNQRTWLVDVSGAPARTIGDGQMFEWAGGNALWRIGPAVPGPGNALYRFDLSSSREQVWLDVDQYLRTDTSLSPVPTVGGEGAVQTPQDNLYHSIGIVGFDENRNPVVELGAAGAQSMSATLLVTGPQVAIAIVPPGANRPGHFVPRNAVGGASSVWMIDFAGSVAVYRDSGTTSIVANIPVPANSYAQLGGTCG